jgi:hypothetical protein
MLPFGRMRGSGWWPGNAQRRTVTVAGVDQVAAGTVAATDRAWARAMAGRSGSIRAGNSLSQSYSWKGYMAYDTLALLRTVGASTNLRGSPNISLPGTVAGRVVAGPGAAGHTVADSLASIPAGYR